MSHTLKVSVYDGKYTVVQKKSGNVSALRYGKPWRCCTGDGLILSLAQEVDSLREKLNFNTLHICSRDMDILHMGTKDECEEYMNSQLCNTSCWRVLSLSDYGTHCYQEGSHK